MPVNLMQPQTFPTPLNFGHALPQDVMIGLRWAVTHEQDRTVLSQDCILRFDATHRLCVSLAPEVDTFAFRLTAGTLLGADVTAHVQVHMQTQQGQQENADSNDLPIQFPSAVIPEREALTAVYSELNQELRRMRTLYETFLVVVTGGFATLVSKADAIAGAQNRGLMGVGLFVLAGIVIFLLWQVAPRYNRNTLWAENIETALGFRSRGMPSPLFQTDVGLFRVGGKRHACWAVMLMLYTAILGTLAAWYLLHQEAPDPVTQAPTAQTIQTIQQTLLPPPSPENRSKATAPARH